MLNHAPPARLPARRVLDLGCGPGLPIAAYLSDRGCAVTGVDGGAASMVALFRQNLPPRATGIEADMRGLELGERFEVVLAWNSFFHLSAEDQRGMFATFAAHAAPRAVLMFTSGPSAGEAIGEVEGQPIYHASLAPPEEYRKLLVDNGFAPISFTPETRSAMGIRSGWRGTWAEPASAKRFRPAARSLTRSGPPRSGGRSREQARGCRYAPVPGFRGSGGGTAVAALQANTCSGGGIFQER